jgi:hypothetical protein
MIFFHQFFTWNSLGDVDLHISVMFVRKDDAVQVATKWAAWLYHRSNQSINMTDRVAVSSLTVSLLQKISVATDHLLQIALSWKFLNMFEKWCKFWSWLELEHVKWDLPVFFCHAYYFFLNLYLCGVCDEGW